MNTCGKFVILTLLMGLFGCSLSGDDSGILVFSYNFDFSEGQNEWSGDFADFSSNPKDSAKYELKFDYTELPGNLVSRKAMMFSGYNYSSTLFMFMKRKVTDLTPNTDYAIAFDIELASNAPKGAVGIGGAPGESVFLKAGATGSEPKKVIENKQYSLNIDKGSQSNPGESTVVLGDIAVDYNTQDFTLITRNNTSTYNNTPFVAKTNSKGELWLIVGTDSGYAGTTTVFYTKVNVIFSTAN